MTEREILDELGKRMQELRMQNKTDTQEYEDLSDEWQSLAHNILMGDLLDDDAL